VHFIASASFEIFAGREHFSGQQDNHYIRYAAVSKCPNTHSEDAGILKNIFRIPLDEVGYCQACPLFFKECYKSNFLMPS
jgi:hypothetical protein